MDRLIPIIDTHIGHIYGHIRSYHSGHFGHFVENGHYGLTQYGHTYGQYGCLCEEPEKCRLPVETE